MKEKHHTYDCTLNQNENMVRISKIKTSFLITSHHQRQKTPDLVQQKSCTLKINSQLYTCSNR